MLYIATDHAGFETKNAIVEYLKNKGLACTDIWPFEYNALDDYPDFIIPCALKVAEDLDNNLGIILGGSGQGEAIAANKVLGIRAAIYYGWDTEILTLSKLHNNANILSLWGRFLTTEQALEAIDIWLEAKFEDEERHVRRVEKISMYEKLKS